MAVTAFWPVKGSLKQKLKEANQAAVDVKMLLRGLREFMEVRRLTPTIVNTLIRRIEVHSNEKKYGHGNVKVDIYFTAAGMLDMPSEEEMVKLMEEIRQQQGQKLSAQTAEHGAAFAAPCSGAGKEAPGKWWTRPCTTVPSFTPLCGGSP